MFKGVNWVFFDVDGVLTDGRLYYSSVGEEYKVFNVKDGLGILNLKSLGIKIGVISGRGGDALLRRLEELKVNEVVINRPDKGNAFNELLKKYGDEVLNSVCVGDDLPDLELFQKCRFGFAVNDAVPEVIEHADIVLKKNGGYGAVREACDLIFKDNL